MIKIITRIPVSTSILNNLLSNINISVKRTTKVAQAILNLTGFKISSVYYKTLVDIPLYQNNYKRVLKNPDSLL